MRDSPHLQLQTWLSQKVELDQQISEFSLQDKKANQMAFLPQPFASFKKIEKVFWCLHVPWE